MSTTETTSTEKISRADLVLLATEVMGWKEVENDWSKSLDDLLPSENHFTVRTHDKFQDAVCRFVDGNLIEFDPTRDTAEGLWQAKQLLEAWCSLIHDSGYRIERLVNGLFRVELRDVDWLQPVVEAIEPLAIVRAVLAAVKAETHG